MDKPRIYADLMKWEEVDGQRRVILTTQGTWRDLQRHGIKLKEGQQMDFWMDDADDNGNIDPLHFHGILHYGENAKHWIAAIDRATIHNASEENKSYRETVHALL